MGARLMNARKKRRRLRHRGARDKYRQQTASTDQQPAKKRTPKAR